MQVKQFLLPNEEQKILITGEEATQPNNNTLELIKTVVQRSHVSKPNSQKFCSTLVYQDQQDSCLVLLISSVTS